MVVEADVENLVENFAMDFEKEICNECVIFDMVLGS